MRLIDAEQSDLAEIIAAAQIGAHHFAARHGLRDAHHSGADQVKRIRLLAFLADDLVLVVGDQLDLLLEIGDELVARRVAKSGTLRRWVSSERSRYFFSISTLKEVPLNVGTFTFDVAFEASETWRLPTSMSRMTRSISTITHGSRVMTVAERG